MLQMPTWPLLYGPSNSTSCASFVHAVCSSFSQAATPGTCLGREYRNPLLIVEAVDGLCHFPGTRRQLLRKTEGLSLPLDDWNGGKSSRKAAKRSGRRSPGVCAIMFA